MAEPDILTLPAALAEHVRLLLLVLLGVCAGLLLGHVAYLTGLRLLTRWRHR